MSNDNDASWVRVNATTRQSILFFNQGAVMDKDEAPTEEDWHPACNGHKLHEDALGCSKMMRDEMRKGTIPGYDVKNQDAHQRIVKITFTEEVVDPGRLIKEKDQLDA